MVVAVFGDESGVDVLDRDVDRPDPLQAHHDCPRMIPGIVTDHDAVYPVIDVFAVAISILGIEIFTFQTEVVACSPPLAGGKRGENQVGGELQRRQKRRPLATQVGE